MIKDNQVVTIHYTGKTKDGRIFDTSRDKSPLRYISNRVPPVIPSEFIEQLKFGKEGDIFNLVWKSEDAFGEYNPYLLKEIHIDEIPSHKKVGDVMKAISENHGEVFLRIKEINGDKVIVDANHPLAGEDLYYEVEIISIRDI